jgi:hypothetical protein
MKCQINVTKQDIEISRDQLKDGKSRAFHCPVAKAAKRRFKAREAAVTGFFVYIKKHQYELPQSARDFIRNFDEGHDVKPIRFYVESGE